MTTTGISSCVQCTCRYVYSHYSDNHSYTIVTNDNAFVNRLPERMPFCFSHDGQRSKANEYEQKTSEQDFRKSRLGESIR